MPPFRLLKENYTSSFFSFPFPLCQGNIKPPSVAVSWLYEVILNLFKSGLQVNAFNITHVEITASFAYAIPTPRPWQGTGMALACCAAFPASLLPQSCANTGRLGHQVITQLSGPLAFPLGCALCDPRLYFQTIFLSIRHCSIFK